MVFMKDYKLLYEATRLDLKDQVDLTTRLQADVERLEGHLVNDAVNRRERIATEIFRRGFWDERAASDMARWIDAREPKKEITVASWLPEKPKRKYTKRSKRWKKKSAKKSA